MDRCRERASDPLASAKLRFDRNIAYKKTEYHYCAGEGMKIQSILKLPSNPIIGDMATRLFGLLRQHGITKGDPIHFEPCIDPHATKLGFHHMYTRDSDRQTNDWLTAPVYVGEARKRHPIDACHIAISQFHELLLTGGERSRDAFLVSAYALLRSGENVTLKGHNCFLIPHFDQLEDYRSHHKPWVASMVQGWAACLFLRAYQVDGNERFVDAARRTCGIYRVAVEDGGILGRLPHGLAFYEKYPFPGQTRHVLNGFMSSLFGLHDLANVIGDSEAKSLFDAGINTLTDARTLHAFDNGYSTLYDLRGDRRATPAGVFYTWVHARQMAGLARITRSDELWRWAQHWRDYVFLKRHTMRSSADCMGFRTRHLLTYARRYLYCAERDANS
jgi:D-glucuronyl C5-epimerase C-terminus